MIGKNIKLRGIGQIFNLNVIISPVAILMVSYQILSIIRPWLSPVEAQNVHLAFSLALIFLVSIKARKGWLLRARDLAFLGLAIIITGYIGIFHEDLIERIGVPTTIDIWIGTLMIIVVLEATRRSFGWSIPIVAIFCLLYAFLGNYIPGFFHHGGFSYTRLIGSVTIYLDGVFGAILQSSMTIIAIFMILGGFLGATGASKYFIEIGMRIGQYARSGPGLAAVVASALFGSVNGSPSANVATTGAFTIPMMKQYGFKPEFAAAVESAASTGGNFLPPVMGVAAFLMSSMTGIPYTHIALHAALPGVLYYVSVGMAVHLRALRVGIRPIPKDLLVARKIYEHIFMGLPIFASFGVIIFLIVQMQTPGRAALWGITLLLFFIFIKRIVFHFLPASEKTTELEVNEKEKLPIALMLVNGCVEGAVAAARIGAACATLGIIVKAFVMTGLSGKIAYQMAVISGGNLWIALLIICAIALLFGCGIPTIGCYVIVAILGVPILIENGISLIAAHLFVVYFTMISAITPPVGIASLIASQLAGSRYWPTGLLAFRLALPAFILPFLFVLDPALLGYGDFLSIVIKNVFLAFGIIAFCGFFESYLWGPCNFFERWMLLGSSLLFFSVVFLKLWISGLGLVILAIVVLNQEVFHKRIKIITK